MNALWEFVIVDSGTQPIGRDLDLSAIGKAMQPMLRRAKGTFSSPTANAHTSGPAPKPVHAFSPKQVFGSLLETMGIRRLSKRRVNWCVVAATLKESNAMLSSAPDRKLRRIARPSLPMTSTLSKKIVLYTWCVDPT